MDPFKIPTPALVSFSGGRTSGYMLYQILKAYKNKLPKDLYITFANTGKEMPETLDFINQCSEKWGVKIHWLEFTIGEEKPFYRTKEVCYKTASRNGEPFAAMIDRKKMLPNPFLRFCTSELKVNVMKRFMKSKGHKEWFNVIGLRYDEPRRVAKQKQANATGQSKWESLFPLYDAEQTVEDVSKFWDNNDFDLKLPTHNGKTLAGNCDLCFLKGRQSLTRLIKERPDLANWWIEQEQKIVKTRIKKFGEENKEKINQTASFRKGITYIELVDISQRQVEIDFLDDDTRSCFCHD